MSVQFEVADMQRAQSRLTTLLQAGDFLYFVERHRSASGQTRWYDIFIVRDRPERVTFGVAALTSYPYGAFGHEAISFKGGGGPQEITQALSKELFARHNALKYELL